MQRATVFFMMCALFLCGAIGFAQEAPMYLSPGTMAMSEGGDVLYIGAQTARKILVFDVASRSVIREIALSAQPNGLALSGDGTQLIVTLDGAPGLVQVLNSADGSVVREIPAGHTPMAPVLAPDGKTLYVCNRFDSNVVRINLETGAVEATVPAGREPVAAAISTDGAYLLVANQIPAGRADEAYTAATVSVIHTPTNAFVKALALPNGSSSLRDIALSPEGDFAYVTHILSRYQLPTTQLERGWMNTNALTIIDVAKREILNTVLLDSVDLGAANPWAVACTADGAHLVVTQAGTHEISVIDRAALHDKLNRVAAGEKVSSVSAKPEDVPNDLSFLVDVRRRIRLTGNGPRAVALAGSTAYIGEYFSDTLCVVDFGVDSRPRPESIALAAVLPQTAERLGEQYFHDAALCFQQWQSCASCHPDARADALNWDLLNDGMGNPKNTKNMLYSHVTPPSMMSGIRESAETAVRSGIKFIQFAVRPEEDAQAIDAYLKALRPLPSPWLVDGGLSEKAQAGKEIFERAGCAGCHSGTYFTDLQSYDVGTGRNRDEGVAFDTPTLVEIWRTAPYLYDGRATTMNDVLTRYNRQDLHGVTTTLTEDELAALAEYVLSL
jgi:YVTN family beta-propeller protein